MQKNRTERATRGTQALRATFPFVSSVDIKHQSVDGAGIILFFSNKRGAKKIELFKPTVAQRIVYPYILLLENL